MMIALFNSQTTEHWAVSVPFIFLFPKHCIARLANQIDGWFFIMLPDVWCCYVLTSKVLWLAGDICYQSPGYCSSCSTSKRIIFKKYSFNSNWLFLKCSFIGPKLKVISLLPCSKVAVGHLVICNSGKYLPNAVWLYHSHVIG